MENSLKIEQIAIKSQKVQLMKIIEDLTMQVKESRLSEEKFQWVITKEKEW